MPARTSLHRHFGTPIQNRRRALFLTLAFGGFATPIFGATYELRVITSDDGEATRKILQVLARRLPGYHRSNDPQALRARRGSAVYVTLGPAALQTALDADLSGPLLSLFTSSEAYVRLTGESSRPRQHGPTTAIYAEASPAQQMRLIRALYGRRVSVGVLLTANTAYAQAALRLAARTNDLELDVQIVSAGENPVHALTRVRSAVVLLAVPDRELYTSASFRNILESTYRRNQPMIGFSSSLVEAGTLAAAYSTIEDIIAQAADVIEALAAGRLPEPQHPLYWRVAINDSVAKSMNIVVEPAARALGNPSP